MHERNSRDSFRNNDLVEREFTAHICAAVLYLVEMRTRPLVPIVEFRSVLLTVRAQTHTSFSSLCHRLTFRSALCASSKYTSCDTRESKRVARPSRVSSAERASTPREGPCKTVCKSHRKPEIRVASVAGSTSSRTERRWPSELCAYVVGANVSSILDLQAARWNRHGFSRGVDLDVNAVAADLLDRAVASASHP
jgi:hypothetical protein